MQPQVPCLWFLISHVLNLSLKASPNNAFIYLGNLDRRITLQHCKVLRPNDTIFCGMADYLMEKCTFGSDMSCVKSHIIPHMAKYVAQYDKIHQESEYMNMGPLKVRIHGKDVCFEQVNTVHELKDRVIQRGSFCTAHNFYLR